uniref:Uncharacterized protein n=1 Tax=viral metagenome TaxID=1070528 RepID=A0A6M3KJD5_9ZZZZ
MVDDKKTDDKALENFTGIDPNNLPEEMQKIYKSMQADYTRKTQELASKGKEYSEREGKMTEQLKTFGAMEQELKQWRDWYKGLEDEVDKPDTSKTTKKADTRQADTNHSYLDDVSDDQSRQIVGDLKKEIDNLKAELSSVHTAFKDTTSQTNRLFNYHAQLNDLAGKHKNIDKKALLQHAIDTGQTDLEKAYKDMYRDELIQDEVERKLQERLDEEKAKMRTSGIHGPGHQVIIKPRSDSPKSFAEASEQILQQRAAEGKF